MPGIELHCFTIDGSRGLMYCLTVSVAFASVRGENGPRFQVFLNNELCYFNRKIAWLTLRDFGAAMRSTLLRSILRVSFETNGYVSVLSHSIYVAE